MKPIEYYILLHKIDSSNKINKPFHVTLEQLSEVFFCTRRNVSNILAKLQAEGWIRWVSGNGRKNRSEITLLKDLELLIRKTAERYMLEGDLNSVLRFHELIDNRSFNHVILDIIAHLLGFSSAHIKQEKKDILRIPFHRPLSFF